MVYKIEIEPTRLEWSIGKVEIKSKTKIGKGECYITKVEQQIAP